jgi:hypothetical protein
VCAWLVGCPSPNNGDSGTPADAANDLGGDGVTPGADGAVDVAPPPYDAGPAPSCEGAASARRIVDRPGGDRIADPGELLSVGDGYLLGAKYVEERLGDPDGGVGDASLEAGAVIHPTVISDRSIVIPLAADGAARPAVTLYDGAGEGAATSAPRLHRTSAGALALFQEVRNNASAPNFLLRTRAAVLGADGAVRSMRIARERVSLPDSTVVAQGIFGVAARIESIGDGGIVAASPISLLLDQQGMDARPADTLLTSVFPTEALEPRMRPRADGGALLLFRHEGRLGFIPFDGRGVAEPARSYEVVGATIPTLDDAAVVSDGVVAAWSRTLAGGMTEVHVVVASRNYELRLDREIERYAGEGPTSVTVIPAYGGAALLWKRGVDAMARVRVAVVAPDGTIRVAPTDLIPVPGAEGRLSAVADGRRITFVVRDGTRADRWGYTFGRACIPAGM